MGLQLFWFLQGTEVYIAAHGLPHCELPVPKSLREALLVFYPSDKVNHEYNNSSIPIKIKAISKSHFVTGYFCVELCYSLVVQYLNIDLWINK